MNYTHSKYYRTVDFEEAVILEAAGVILEQVEWEDGGRVGTFVFEDVAMCQNVLRKHRHKELLLLSPDVLAAYRHMKNEIHRRH